MLSFSGICVGPSLLWESTQNAPLRTLPTLIEMLINNCQVLFGSQVVSLLGEVAHDSGAEESDSLHCKYFSFNLNMICLILYCSVEKNGLVHSTL